MIGEVCGDSSLHRNVEPLVFEAEFTQSGDLVLETARVRRILRVESATEAAQVDTRFKTRNGLLHECTKTR